TVAARYSAGGFVKSPSVRIEILDYQSRKASVLGQVNAQGLITLDRNYTVAEIIARAGGLSPEAGETAAVVRQLPDGRSQRFTVNLAELTGGSARTEALLPVLPGDVIFVPRAETFSVVGAVNRPGNFRLTARISVQEALAAAGDVTLFGSTSKLKVRRKQADSTVTILVPVALDDPILPGDVLVVRERGF
ncbi:MAG: SLBB domain-containing protein, partial [Polymorphobacter sp.]